MASDARGTTAVSLLITSRLLVAVQVRATGRGAEIIARGTIETPAGTMDGAFVQDTARLGHAIRTLWRHMDLHTRSVMVALPSPDYSLRALRLPEAPVREQRALVRGELEHVAALPIGTGGFDFVWLPAPEEKDPAEVTAYYASDAVIDSIREALQRAGLNIEGMEPASLSLMRAYLAGRSARQKVALLYPAEKHSDLCFHDGDQVRHIRRIPAGWGDMAQIMTPPDRGPLNDALPFDSDWKGDPGEAEERERALSNAPVRGATETEAVSRGAFLAAEVMRSLAFFAREHGEENRPETLVILGPVNVARNVEHALASVKSLPILIADSLSAFALPNPVASPLADADPAEYAAALGAGLGSLDKEYGLPVVDVSQQEAAARTRRRAPVALLAGMAGSTLWMILAAVAAITLSILESNSLNESARLTEEIAITRQEQAPALWYQQTFAAAKAAQAQVHIPASSVLGRVAASTGPGIALTQLSVMRDGRLTITGEAANIPSVQRFAFMLGQGRSIRAPIIQTMNRDAKEGKITFTILGTFPKTAPPPAEKTKEETINPGKE